MSISKTLYPLQWHSQNAEKVMHIKGRLLDQAMILFNCVHFQMGTSLKGKNLLPEGANSLLYEQFLIVWIITSLECYYFFFLSFFLLILARSNFDHYARECNFGILKKKQKRNKKTKTKQKNKKNLSAVFLTK